MRERRSHPVSSLFVLGALQLGCGSQLRLEPTAPEEIALPPTWTATAEEAARTPQVVHWWSAIGDPVLDRLVAEGLEENHDLQIAAARLEAALARARIEGADLHPQLGLDLSGSRAKRNFIGFPIPGGEGQVLSVTSTSLALGLNVSWEADLWGRLQSNKRAAVLETAASEEDLRGARLSLTGQIVKGYLVMVEATEQVRLAERTVESRRLTGRRVRQRYERGLSPSLELRLALTQIANVESSLAQRRRALDLARRQLETLLGRYPAALVEAAATLPATPPPVPPGLPSELLLRRPDLRAAYDRALASTAQLASARAALYPRFTLTGSGGGSSIELVDLVDGDFSVWSLMAGVLQPVFQGGRLRAGVRLASAGEEQALERYVQSTLDAFAEVESALAAQRYLADQVAALEQAVEQSRAAEQLSQQRYVAGLADYLNVLESQREAFVSQSALLDVRRARLNAWVDLVIALGGELRPEAGPRAPSTNPRAG